MADPREKLDRLHALLSDMGSVLVAYSGGVDSAFLLKVAVDSLGEHARRRLRTRSKIG